MSFGRIKESSIPLQLKVSIGQTFKADSLSINTQELTALPLKNEQGINMPGPLKSELVLIESYCVRPSNLPHYMLEDFGCSSIRYVCLIQNF